MSDNNLFWPVYKNLENEVLKLANNIHFSDDQIKVYSMHVADLIVRCSIEIEAISKELYLSLGGSPTPYNNNGSKRNLFFDTDCLDLLESRWHLSKKQVMISASTFYFSGKNKILTPLKNANKHSKRGSKWKQAYQSVKHDRKSSLKMGNIDNLIQALSALYILNLYYKNELLEVGLHSGVGNKFDNRVGSEIFSIYVYRATLLSLKPLMDDSCIFHQEGNEFDRSIYILKYNDESFRKLHEAFLKESETILNKFNNSPEIAMFLKENPDYNVESIDKTCLDAGGINLLNRIQNSSSFKSSLVDAKTEVILNKHTTIYPTLHPPDVDHC